MTRLVTAAVGLLVMGMTSGCAATMSAGSHVDRTLNFGQYRTFDWGPADALPTGDPRLDRDPYFKDYMQGAVERGLRGRGIELVDSGAQPDLLIHYHANVTERIDVNRADRAYGYCASADCPPDTVSYEAGTLVVDLMDARTNKLVWRGWAQSHVDDLLRNRDAMVRTINQAVTEMLREFPRTR